MSNEEYLPSIHTVQKRLHIGDKIKNYKSLCVLLDIATCGGNQKKAQLKYFDRLFSYEKDGNAFVITDIYDEIEPEERSLRKDAIYQRTIEIILLEYLRDRGDQSCIKTYMEWAQTLSMVNCRYGMDSDKRNIQHNEIRIPVIGGFGAKIEDNNKLISNYNYDAFFSYTSDYFTRTLRRVFDDLENKRHVIFWNKVYVVYDGNNRYIADDFEIKLIQEAYQEAMQIFGIKEEYQIYTRNQTDIRHFYASVSSRVRKKLNLQYPAAGAYSAIKIVYSEKYLKEQIEYSNAKLQEVINARRELNCKCYDWCNHYAVVTYYNSLSDGEKKWYSIAAQKDMADYYILQDD